MLRASGAACEGSTSTTREKSSLRNFYLRIVFIYEKRACSHNTVTWEQHNGANIENGKITNIAYQVSQ